MASGHNFSSGKSMSAQSRVILSLLLSSSMLAGCLADGSLDSDELGDDTIAEKGEADGAEDGVLKDEVPWTKVTVFAEAGQWGYQFMAGSTGGGHPNTISEIMIDKDWGIGDAGRVARAASRRSTYRRRRSARTSSRSRLPSC